VGIGWDQPEERIWDPGLGGEFIHLVIQEKPAELVA